VAAAGIPTAGAEVAAIEGTSLSAARAVADSLNAASKTLTADPDPTNGRSVSARVRLALLVDAEAARAAEGADLAPAQASALRGVAHDLAAIGDGLWDPALGARTTHFATAGPPAVG